MNIRSFVLMFFLMVGFVGCGGISMISKQNVKDLYSEKFLMDIGAIKEQYRQGNSEIALINLKKIDENKLLPSERALRRNLIGVIYFSRAQFEQGVYHFELALGTSRLDNSLTSQVKLNLASSYFKLGFMPKAFSIVENTQYKHLNPSERKKFHLLRFKIARETGKSNVSLVSLANYLGDLKNLDDLRNDPYFQYLQNGFFKLKKSEKVRFLEEFEENKILSIGYLGYLEVEKLYYTGEKDGAKSLLSWIEDKYGENVEIKKLVEEFSYRRENYSKMDKFSIGVILPLTGNNKDFGKRALLGIDSAIKDIAQSMGKKESDYNIYIKDSKGSGAVGAYWAKELIEKYRVSTIIGGLFSSEASKEYLEAKKNGVFFISLDQVYLPKDEKDHLLLEIPGSVESQINMIFSDPMLEKFGRKASIIYPNSRRGKAYVNEFWRKSKINKVEITNVLSFEKNKTDYRDTIKKLLGLKFKRGRQEELELLADIHALEKSSSARRIQTLNPEIDFDWAFIPAFPKEALQIIPSFSYYDAFRLNLIGGPSWRSQAISKESYKLGKLFFVGDDVQSSVHEFTQNFYRRYSKKPRLIEMRAYDAFRIMDSLVSGSDFERRDEFDIYIRSKENLLGITGNWKLNEKVWVKDLVSLKLNRGKIEKVFEEPEPKTE